MKNKIVLFTIAILIVAPIVGYAGVKYDAKLTEKMKGKILLQIDSKGEAWYINPKDGKRYYMKDGNSALQIMRKFGQGIKTTDLEKIPVGTIEISNTTSKTPENQPEAQKQWQSVFKVSASSDKQTENFKLNGGQQKIVYKNTGSMSTCYVYVMKENTSLDKDGGFPTVSIDGDKSDETMMRKEAGNYYLDIKTVNGVCDVEVFELR